MRNRAPLFQDPKVAQAATRAILRDYGLIVEGVNEAYEHDRRRALWENYAVKSGQKVEVLPEDDHALHIEVHRQALVGYLKPQPWHEKLRAHIQEHEALLKKQQEEAAQQVAQIQAMIKGKQAPSSEGQAPTPQEGPLSPVNLAEQGGLSYAPGSVESSGQEEGPQTDEEALRSLMGEG